MKKRRPQEWLLAAVSGVIHGGFWWFVTRELRVQTAIPAGPLVVALVAFVLGGMSVLAVIASRPWRALMYVGVAAALAAGIYTASISETLFGLDIDSPLIPVGIGLLVAVSLAFYLAWMIAFPRKSVPGVAVVVVFALGLWVGVAIAGTNDPHEVHVPPDLGAVEFPDWKMGDVHVHAAGDRDLVKHPDCRKGNGEYLEGLACARALVSKTAAAAANSQARWIILVEHGAWLAGGLDYDKQKGIEEWEQLRTAAQELSPSTGVRMLIGEELGSAIVSFAGHFSAYYTPSYVPNSVRRIPDVQYVERVASLDGWGSINHPFQGGNKWECWYPSRACDEGAVGFADPTGDTPATFRAIELSNGGRFPAQETLAMWDELLVQGYRVWGVGGSDAHTRSKDSANLVHARVGYPNIAKVGISRTYAQIEEDITPVAGFDAADPDDPVRAAIYSGAVVASNGPRALAVLDDKGPGETATIPAGNATVEVGVKWPTQFTEKSVDPDEVRITYSKISPGCGDACPRPLVVVRAVPPDADAMSVPLAIPEEWDQAYVRVEVATSGDKPFGAFVSPIFIERGPAPEAS